MKILIRLPNWLGDVVISTALINSVLDLYPNAVVDVIIKKELGSIASLIPGINKIHLFSKLDHKGISGVYRFGKSLRSEQYDLLFNLPSSFSSSLMGFATGAKKRVGFAKEGSFLFLTHSYPKPRNLHRVEEYQSLVEQFSGKKLISKRVKLKPATELPMNRDRVLVNFNSEASSRRMPVEKGKRILSLLVNTFPETHFVFIGAPKEAAFVDEIIIDCSQNRKISNFAGKTDLVGLCDLMSSSAALLTTDSGPAHLANSVGCATIVLFGAGNEHNTAPFNKEDLNILRYGKLNCEPCVKNKCELYDLPKCMQMLDELQMIDCLTLYLHHA